MKKLGNSPYGNPTVPKYITAGKKGRKGHSKGFKLKSKRGKFKGRSRVGFGSTNSRRLTINEWNIERLEGFTEGSESDFSS